MKKPILLLFAVLLFSGIASSQEGSTIKIRQEFSDNELVVSIEGAEGVAGYQFDIKYNPAVLKYQDISFGGFLSSDGVETFKVNPRTDTSGLIKAVAEARTGRNPGLNGSGTLFTIKFDKTSEGVSGLELSYAKMVDVEGKEILAEIIPLPQQSANSENAPSISSDILIIIAAIIVVIVGTGLLPNSKNSRSR
jgi:hypothetical protein